MMRKIFIIFFLTLATLLITDYLFGKYLLKLTPKKINPSINHKIYDHDLKKNFKGILEWSPGKTYTFCTDKNSFRTFCDSTDLNGKEFDIAFIGDSFTLGVGLDYEETFVAKISKNFDDLKIANLSVVSYSPIIYYSKLNHLINNGYKFKRVIIYFDISDVYDDNKKYRLIGDKITRKKSIFLSNFQKNLKSLFPFLSYSTKTVKNNLFKKKDIKKNKCNYLDYCHEKSSWTFNKKYFGENEINKTLKYLNMTYKLLNKNNIKMSLGIYPWPAQILHDEENSKVVKIMSNFCLNKCEYFFNNYPDFFKELKISDKASIVSKYYIKNDVHFNAEGNQKLFINFLNNFKN